ncbi:DUF763 domain-containing protein [Anaeromyxobacter diazotrophicus]|uniref:DUF763 domain-containing protein n=1 Tax=Anaeromyxobacter diazotrophicus TaxID=2590199 RepID=A0A7I9VJ00_9BACT|nr:DUF763 domain-containing protein [Anaeromyxobacter diazotrophicus]GEJ56333.1 hypothetical protein AMYX_10740 [Anaeromyxobacter diazotrophicus]
MAGQRAGTADLPLHGGNVPPWLRARMARLGRVMVEALVLEYGRAELLRRLAHPFWFQSLGAFMGMDWHSSGITTSVLGALKRGLAPVERELGVHVCGGRGRHARGTPDELARVGELTGLDGGALAGASRLVAKVDTAAVQDGFDLYLHAFVVTDDGGWAVVQQGMNTGSRRARRYHWLSEGLESFVEAPHAAIEGQPGGAVVNLTDPRAAGARAAQVELARSGPDAVVAEVRRLRDRGALPALQLPAHHDVRPSDVLLRRLHGAMAAAAARGPADFQALLLVPGVGARTVLALALAAEVLHGAPCRFSDPARFSLAHGGKDGHPFPVPLRVYDRTVTVLREAVDRARLGQDDKLAALRRLDAEARRLEAAASGPGLQDFLADERARSAEVGGRSVFGPSTATATATATATPTATPTATSNSTATPTATARTRTVPAQLRLFR